jgi:hypothetical protein
LQNLNTLFNTSSQSVELTAPQSDQIATIYKRQNSSKWQVRFKLPSGNWHAASTGQTNLDIANDRILH